MSHFTLSGITVCISPIENDFVYDIVYNKDLIKKIYSKDYKINGITTYGVVCVFGSSFTGEKSEEFKFTNSVDRDIFYESI